MLESTKFLIDVFQMPKLNKQVCLFDWLMSKLCFFAFILCFNFNSKLFHVYFYYCGFFFSLDSAISFILVYFSILNWLPVRQITFC